MKSHYTKKINDWELNITYDYIPAEASTQDYPGVGSSVEVEAVYLEHSKSNNKLQIFEISDFLYEFCPDEMYELEKEITEYHEDN
tara:strand:+ start:296 stop:550 length:255 start_codon:yes stop_codon:yes gene_type:complete